MARRGHGDRYRLREDGCGTFKSRLDASNVVLRDSNKKSISAYSVGSLGLFLETVSWLHLRKRSNIGLSSELALGSSTSLLQVSLKHKSPQMTHYVHSAVHELADIP
jgi:hypothetical protein